MQGTKQSIQAANPCTVRRHFRIEMELRLEKADRYALQAWRQRAEALGLTFDTLADLSEQASTIYECHMECRRLQPPVETRVEPQLFDLWQTTFLNGEDALPQAYFLLKSAVRPIGVCALVKIQGQPRRLLHGFTGIVPDWTGRELAKALKAHAILWAIEQNFERLETDCLLINRSMVAVNKTLGFQETRRKLHTFRLTPLEPQSLDEPCDA